jgi:hypothetical protein
MTTDIDIANRALEMIASQQLITTFADPTNPASVAASVLYAPVVQMLLRQMDPDFARRTNVPLVLQPTPNQVPTLAWAIEYVYPADCLRLRQVAPATWNIFDPQPVRANVGTDVVVGVPIKIILTNAVGATATYTTSLVTENQWDSLFAEAVVRQLANPFAMALSGRPDFAKELLDQAASYEQMAELDDEGMARSI